MDPINEFHRKGLLRTIDWYGRSKQWVNVKYKASGEVRLVSPYRARKDVDAIYILGCLPRPA